MSAPSISVVICTYNNAGTLDHTLRHLADQEGTAGLSWDILVVDNNCTDRTQDVVRAWTTSMPVPCRAITETRQGVNHARVAGARHSTGDWIAYIDDDCLLEPGWLREAASFIARHPDAGGFGGQVVLRWEEPPPPPYVEGFGYAFAETRLGDQELKRTWLAGAGMVLRRAALVATGWLDVQLLDDRIGRRLVSGGDVELGLRIAEQFEIWYAPHCVLHHSIPARRTERRYLRRLVFGLGRSSHDVALLTWTHGPSAWWRHAARRAGRLAAEGTRKALADVVRRRPGQDSLLAVAFASGWLFAMAAYGRAGAMARHERMGQMARFRAPENRL